MFKLFMLPSVTLLLSVAAISGCTQTPNTQSSTPTASASSAETDKAKPVIASTKPALTPVGVKTIKPEPALKAGKKLSPEEVEDLIRKLSVCRPT
ncbi:MAG: hypothetical protein ACH34X_02160 [Thiolinea sp.]